MTTTNSPAAPVSMNKKNDLLPDLKIEKRSIKSLKRSKHAVRRSSNRQKKKCIASIERFGFCQVVLISDNDEIVDGHALVDAALALGLTVVPCICIAHLGARRPNICLCYS